MYNPSLHTATNKPIGLTNKPVDARTYYYDNITFSYRPYESIDEVLAYLIDAQRVGHFSIIIQTAGINAEWWFKDGILDGDLVVKDSGVTPTPPDEHFIEAGVTEMPLILPYDSATYPRWNAVKTDTGEYDQIYPVVYNMTDQQFEINALDDGSGKALESYTFTINP